MAMDILKPPIIKIGNRRYRKNVIVEKNATTDVYQYCEEENVSQSEHYYDDSSQQLNDLDFQTTDAGFSLGMNVPSVYYKYIIGKKGEMRKKLEVETKTRIRIPNVGESGDIVIWGHDKAMIASAKTRIDVLVSSQRHRQPFTHFLAFPLNNETVQFNFGEFKLDVLRECHGDRGIDETIFQNPQKMHLTLGTLVLLNQAEIDEATAILVACRDDINKAACGKGGINVGVRGLEYMNDDPADVDVLYAKVVSLVQPQLLETLSNRITDRFTSCGVMDREYDNVKIHMTVMNSLIRKDPASGALIPMAERRRMKDRESFDATKVLQMFGDYFFGDCTIPSLDLCLRYGTTCTGYYTKVASLPLS